MALADPVPRLDDPLPPLGGDDGPGGGDDGPDGGGHGGGDDDGAIAPWWHARWRLAVLAVALLFLGASAGYALAVRQQVPAEGSVDVGFLQDMRLHHDQAVQMSMILLDKPAAEGDPGVRAFAREIVLGQQIENGLMVQLLRGWGRSEVNDTGVAMTWMDMPPTASDAMPGMASTEQLDALRSAAGREADVLWLELMIAHHEGGLHMAEHALDHAGDDDVRVLADSMLGNQRGELLLLQEALDRLTTG